MLARLAAARSAASASTSGSPSRSRTTSSTAPATTIETGKVAGTDLREGTPTLPLLLAAREDDVVRAALAGGPIEGALVRVAATGALERSREVALDYAGEARESLNGGLHRERARVARGRCRQPESAEWSGSAASRT